jgi:tRNA(adenine34) deaminase
MVGETPTMVLKHITDPHWPFHPKTVIESGVLQQECAQLMKDFFKQRRS